MPAREVARDIVRCCRSLREAGLIAGADGNVSVRLGPDRVLVTPHGLLKSELRPDDLVEVNLAGSRRKGSRQATSELDLHLRVYRRRKDCGAVVHAHPPTATAFAVAGEGLPGDVLPEIVLLMGEVPCVQSLEHAARILLAARALGRVNRPSREQIDVLARMRGTSPHGQTDFGY